MRLLQISILFNILFIGYSLDVNCQQWQKIDESSLQYKHSSRAIIPENYNLYKVDYKEVVERLSNITGTVSMKIPGLKSQTHQVKLYPNDVLHPNLSKKYPGIYSFTGHFTTCLSTKIKVSISQKGMSAVVFGQEQANYFIDRHSSESNDYYSVYEKQDLVNTHDFRCYATEEDSLPEDSNKNTQYGDCQLRKYRLALACTGEYAQYHGGTKADVLAEYNVLINRVNGIYETELGITFELIENTDDVIFLNGDIDPYTNDDGAIMLNENVNTMNQIIGIDNFDIGHVVSTGGGGIATFNSPCTSIKARGVTGQPDPVADPFYVDFVCHEIGHQFGARHTFNNNCDDNVSAGSAYEPGSGSTIMAYAGICDPNIQDNSDPYFHAVSLQQMANFVINGQGSCGEIISDINESPVILSITESDLVLPAKTPFILSVAAEDSDDDNLTYCWEQLDNELVDMPPMDDNPFGPAFRSYAPNQDSFRVFPRMSDILSGANNNTWERLTSVDRNMLFNVVVRDNSIEGGCSVNQMVPVSFASNSGPFFILSQNTTGIQWEAGSQELVQWDVANTDSPPVSCNNVDILLSTDGGNSFDIMLASNIANNGSAMLTAPAISTETARIMIRCSSSIFFDVNNRNISISNALSGNASVIQPVSCFDGNDGSLLTNASGGAMPYRYSLDGEDYQDNPLFENLMSGLYQVFIKDDMETVFTTAEIQIENPDPISIQLDITPNQMIINAEGGSGNFTYSLDGTNYSSINVITIMDGVTYDIYVKDSNECIQEGQSFTYYLISGADIQLQNVKCKNDNTGTVEVTSILGGKSPYMYSLNAGELQDLNLFQDLFAGDYILKVVDSELNEYSTSLSITEPDENLTLDSQISENTITLMGVGGDEPYEYRLDSGMYSTVNIFPNLDEGTYAGYVKDANNCEVSSENIIINTSLSELYLSKVIAYPNPTSGEIKLTGLNDLNVSFKLYNNLGQKVESGFLKDEENISIGSLNHGIYLLKLQYKEVSKILKILVNPK